ncbi:MBL fold metallo-hydrolase [Bacillus lacus]|uniref:MBL fold metallo-hydrolase n=1 Tax=Metabacillus lacus TaxID=1983721 RepID=A0A7X2J1K0_9BACI|nr:MBL fold metallo-hydrolase [Metabacillus lacus]MRX73787.1 MBL fold metallo-hydrolase [Metabacillus lacus]
MATIHRVSESISIIDTHDLGRKARTSAYLLHEEKLTLIETSASPSLPHIQAGLEALGCSLSDLHYIIVTHIHLDHAGGAGLLLEKCPNATLIVHPKGARHLINPEKLIAGAKAVYGPEFHRLFHPVVPVSEERIIVKHDQETLDLSPLCTLKFYDSPGHANHHFSLFETRSKGLFSGDSLGIFYQELLPQGKHFYLPSTSPNQFHPENMLKSAERMRLLSPSFICFSHFGVSREPEKVFSSLNEWLPVFLECTENTIKREGDKEPEKLVHILGSTLLEKVNQELASQGVSITDDLYDILKLDLSVCAMGLLHYYSKRR